MMKIEKQIRLSSEWAAYGDALGFMTELADAERVQYRIGAEAVQDTVGWKRKVGGYGGLSVELPAGTYSDDTQLRLSASRAIRGDGTFDVAAFAKVELTAWANYALGAGVGTREAAANLARTSATWYSNFFKSKRADYFQAGGNGAAMRVQPHVWAARDLSKMEPILLDVVRNSICTHGHPRGILGACFHAVTLAFALKEGRTASLSELMDLAQYLRVVPDLIKRDGDLRLLWLSAWEDRLSKPLEHAFDDVVNEVLDDLTTLRMYDGGWLKDCYGPAVEALGAFDPSSRGSGTKTAILGAFAAAHIDHQNPQEDLLAVINALGSDTDSIATMAGAIIGACSDRECEGRIQDREYITSESARLAAISQGQKAPSTRYPDLRSWKPARAAIDAVGILDGQLWLNGIGALSPIEPAAFRETGSDLVGWCELPFGQTVLVKFRSNIGPIAPDKAGLEHETVAEGRNSSPPPRLRDLFAEGGSRPRTSAQAETTDLQNLTLNESLQRIVSDKFDPELIGLLLLQQVDSGGKDFVEKGVALTATILTAYEARTRRRRDKGEL